MATATLVDIYQALEERLGKGEARKITSVIELGFEAIEKRAEDVALQKKLELKDDLTKELITKAEFYGEISRLEGKIEKEILRLEGKIENDILRLDRKFTVMFVVLFFTVIFLNQNALEFMARVLRLIP